MTVDKDPKATNTQTVKVTVDGMDLSWSRAEDEHITPEAGAKFVTDFVSAMQKFRDRDPRTMPELRKEDKERKEFHQGLWLFFKVSCLVFFVMIIAYQCGSDPGHGSMFRY